MQEIGVVQLHDLKPFCGHHVFFRRLNMFLPPHHSKTVARHRYGFGKQETQMSQVELSCRLPFPVNVIVMDLCCCEPAPSGQLDLLSTSVPL